MITQKNKVKALKISRLWMEIALAATQQIRKTFQLKNSNGHWVTTIETPDLESNLDNWRVDEGDSKKPPIEHALFFVKFWKDISDGNIPEYYHAVDDEWYEMHKYYRPSLNSDPKNWRTLPPKAKEFQTELYKNKAWKCVETAEFTEDPIEAAHWALEGLTLQVFALVEQT